MYQLIPAARNVGLGDTTSYVQLSVPFVTKLISAFANGLSVFISCVTNLKCVALMFSCLLTSEGKVETLRKGSIHAVILGIFSVAIMSDDISEKFKFRRKSDGGRFVSRSDRQHVITRGTMIRFFVKGVDTEMNCHITGSLIPPHTGSMDWLSVHDAEYAAEINGRSRDDSNKIEQNEQEHRILKNEDSMVKSERTHKSRKRSIENR